MGSETHPIPSHRSKRRSNLIPWVKNFLQSVPWDGIIPSHVEPWCEREEKLKNKENFIHAEEFCFWKNLNFCY